MQEMLERILKPSSKDASNIRRSMKRGREESVVPPAEKKPHIAIEENAIPIADVAPKFTENQDVKKENQAPEENQNVKIELADDDMDFSMLDDDENQFSSEVTETTESKTNETPSKHIEEIKADMLRKQEENYANLLSSWENTCLNGDDEDDALLGSIDVDAESIANSTDNKTTMRFWYWDAYEEPIKFPGKVFLFGRMPTEKNPREFKSVCITVENVERNLFLLPRKYALDPITYDETNKEVTITDVYKEFNEYFPSTFKSKKVEKHFAFNVPGVKVPQTSEYLQVSS